MKIEVEQGGYPAVRSEGNHIVSERFEHIDVNNLVQMQEILEIEKDPLNMGHLAGVKEDTGISDIITHYKKDPKERDGRVMLDGDAVVAVFEVSPMDFSRIGLKPDEDKGWEIRSAILNRLAVRSNEHQKGRGTKAVAYAEDVAFKEHDYSTLIAAIILDPEQKKAYNKAFKDGTVNDFVQNYMETDARGKVYLRNRKWAFSGVLMDQGGFREGELTHVILVQKTKIAWEREQKQIQRKSTSKALN